MKLFLRKKRFRTILIVLISLFLLVSVYLFLQKKNTNGIKELEEYQSGKEISKHPEIEKYRSSIRIFEGLAAEAMMPYNDTLSEEIRIDALDRYSRPKWLQAYSIAKNIESHRLPERMRIRSSLLRKYASQRVHEIDLMKMIYKGNRKAINVLRDVRDSIHISLIELEN